MNPECGKEWTRAFLVQVFTKVFIDKKLKEHRENVLFDQERALLPATQPIVEQMIAREKVKEEIDEVTKEIELLYRKRGELYSKLNRINNTRTDEEQNRRQFVRACPSEDCRGFLSTQWKCGLCEQYTCPDCNVVKGLHRDAEEHICSPDDIATTQLLKKDTRPCPKCGFGIFKIDGCPQVWCTLCHTAFNFHTGQIETRVHNPHYYEWIRRTGGEVPRDPNDHPGCGGGGGAPREIDYEFTRNIVVLMRDRKIPKEVSMKVMNLVRSMEHLRLYEFHRYRVDHVLNNQNLRIQYMRNQIDEENFKILLQRENKKYEKKREIFELLNMFLNVSTELLLRYYSEVQERTTEEAQRLPITEEIDGIVRYVNECLAAISTTYGSKLLELVIELSNGRADIVRFVSTAK
jgi:hypothetical protein